MKGGNARAVPMGKMRERMRGRRFLMRKSGFCVGGWCGVWGISLAPTAWGGGFRAGLVYLVNPLQADFRVRQLQ